MFSFFQEGCGGKELEDLVLESNIMKEIGPHPNVVTILGVCTEQGKPQFDEFLVVECRISLKLHFLQALLKSA